MKKGMILFAVTALLSGAACNTYTASTDPDDHGTGYALSGNQVGTGHTSSRGVAEANNNATFDNPQTGAELGDSSVTKTGVNRPVNNDSTLLHRPSTAAPVKIQTGGDH